MNVAAAGDDEDKDRSQSSTLLLGWFCYWLNGKQHKGAVFDNGRLDFLQDNLKYKSQMSCHIA